MTTRVLVLTLALTACTGFTDPSPPRASPMAVPVEPPAQADSAAAESSEPQASPSEPAPEPLSIDRLSAEELHGRLSSPVENLRVVNFWATWCGPCKAEMPELARFAEQHPDVSLWFVNLDHPKAAPHRVNRFIREQALTGFVHIRPAEDEPDLTSKLDDWPDLLPVTLVIQPDGAVHRRLLGAVDLDTLSEAVSGAARK